MKTVPLRGIDRAQRQVTDSTGWEHARKVELHEIVDLANNGIPLTRRQCGILLGTDRYGVERLEKKAMEKLLVALQETPE